MFGKNTIKGQKAFAEAGDRLLVTSLFQTLQGEGPYSGRPAFFVRLAYCNLNCSFCDTFFDDGDWFDLQQLDDAIDARIKQFFNGDVPQWAQPPNPHKFGKREMVLVITGGEPMLQHAIVPFLQLMHWQFRNVQIESNGILLQDIPDSTTLVVSPKCRQNLSGRATAYIKPPQWVLDRANALKFVISSEQGSPYREIPQWALTYRDSTGIEIYLSPMNMYAKLPAAAERLRKDKPVGTIEERSTIDEVVSFWEEGLLDREQNQRNHEYAAQYAIRNGLRLSLQQHLYAGVA